ncbi:MAG: P-loop NTPase [Rhabdochlamydiaceae bacterium]|nr:P-loop NTPase [Candidatus Amphrikana amoebophyrae]
MNLKSTDENGLTKVKNVLGVMAGKGGVGKSTVSTNCAFALQEMGYKVGVIDADIYGPSLKLMLGAQDSPKSERGWIIPVETSGIKLISLSLFKQGEMSNAVRAPIANSIISQFINDVQWGELDYLIVDFPPGTGDIQLTLMQHLQFTAVLFVSTPQKVAVMDVKKSVEMARDMEIPICGVVENMSYLESTNTNLFGLSFVGDLDMKIMAKLPLSSELSECSDRGESLYNVAPESLICHLFLDIAAQVDSFCSEINKIDKMITEIKLVDPYNLELNLRDGKKVLYQVSDLQAHCPCARCAKGRSGVDPKVEATEVSLVGQYAIKLKFSSGCSNGIFSLQTLKRLEHETAH